MATQKPISSISYNSESFLLDTLNKWYKAHIIQSFQYIKHKGEDGDKDHIHFRIEPNKKLDPMCLVDDLREYDPLHPDKPLCVRPFRSSKEEDWYLYAVHDAQYLKLKYNGGDKGEKLPYLWTDIVCNEFYDVEVAFIRAKAYLEHTSVNMATKLQNGMNPIELVLQGENVHTVNAINRALNFNDYNRLNNAYQELKSDMINLLSCLERNGISPFLDEHGIYQLRDVI